jgi:phosphoglycerate dehydrogenase-like enzyme
VIDGRLRRLVANRSKLGVQSPDDPIIYHPMTQSPDHPILKLVIVLQHRLELWNAPGWFAERLRKDFPQIDIIHRTTYDGIEDYIRDAEIIIGWSLRPEQLQSAERLRWIHCPAAAVHQLLSPGLAKSDVIVTNGRDVHGPVVAEHVLALILALAKKLPQAARFQQKHVWGQQQLWDSRPRPREVAGATLGLIGLGSIGRTVARHAFALGMRVIAAREYPEKGSPAGVAQVFSPSELDTLLSQSDYVVLALPLTSQTHSLIDAKRLRKLQPHACLINVGRGPLVDEPALADALRHNQIAGAALDVFAEEPLPATSPLWDLENLLITPHIAGLTEKQWERQYELVAENLRRYLNHQPLLAMVDKQRGY